MDGCNCSWGQFGFTGAIVGVSGLIAYVCIYFWLQGKVIGKDELQKNPWLREIMEKIK